MGRLVEKIANEEITVEELANVSKLIERAKLVTKGVEACKRTLVFPFGTNEVNCYGYVDSAGEYESWGSCTIDGTFTCYNNWGGNHPSGRCNLCDSKDVFMAFENKEFAPDLKRFLLEQIRKSQAN